MTETRLLLATFAALLLIGTPVHAGKIKCWTNSDGVRECGNIVPPEYAQKGHEEINKQGVTVKQHARAKTPEELAEEQRVADAKAEAERIRKEQEEQDRILLTTFSSEDEIVMTRNGKITAIETELRLTRKSMDNTRERLATYEKQAAHLERAGKPIDEKLKKDLKTAQDQVAEYEEFIKNKEREKLAIQEQFDQDMTRYRKLKGRPVAATPSDSAGKKQAVR